jgi:hypothetical protein
MLTPSIGGSSMQVDCGVDPRADADLAAGVEQRAAEIREPAAHHEHHPIVRVEACRAGGAGRG